MSNTLDRRLAIKRATGVIWSSLLTSSGRPLLVMASTGNCTNIFQIIGLLTSTAVLSRSD